MKIKNYLLFFFTLYPSLIFSYNSQFIKEYTYDHFKDGKLENVGINHLGYLFPVPKNKLIYENENSHLIWDIEKDHDENIYFVAESPSKIYKISKNGSPELVYEFSTHLFIMDILIDSKNNLYLADITNSRIIYFSLKEKKILQEYSFQDKYIWKMIQSKSEKSDTIYVVTGLNASVYEISSKGLKQLFSNPKEMHFFTLLQHDDTLYFSGNTLYKLDLKTEKISSIYQTSGDIKNIVLHSNELFFIESNPIIEKSIKKDQKLKNAFYKINSIPNYNHLLVKKNQKDPSELSNQVKKFALPSQKFNTLYKKLSDDSIIKLFETNEYSFINLESSPKQDRIYLGTSSSGVILFLDQASKIFLLQEELSYLIHIQDMEVLDILIHENSMYIASGNIGKIYELDLTDIKDGFYESKIYHLPEKVIWGKIFSDSSNDSDFKFYIRVGNSKEVDPTWSEWYEIKNQIINTSPTTSIQYKVEFSSKNQKQTLGNINISYTPFNPSIAINQILITQGNSNPKTLNKGNTNENEDSVLIKWTIKEENQTIFKSSLYFKNEKESEWIPLLADSFETSFKLDISIIPDGKYYLKVVINNLSDSKLFNSLSYKISDPFIIDTLSPIFSNIEVIDDKDDIEIKFEINDNNFINIVYYSLNQSEWIPILPIDKIYDSNNENFLLKINSDNLNFKQNYLMFKAIDIYGNTSKGYLN